MGSKGHFDIKYVNFILSYINLSKYCIAYLCLKSLFLSVCQKQQKKKEEEKIQEILVVSG